MIRQVIVARLVLRLVAIAAAASAVNASDLPPQAKVLDDNLLFRVSPNAVISPNGQWVAYESRGFVSICNIDKTEPKRLFEVPHTWTHVLAQPEYAYTDGDENAIYRKEGKQGTDNLLALTTHSVAGLQWTPESSAVVFAYQGPNNLQGKFACKIVLAATDGTVTTLAKMDRGVGYRADRSSFDLTRDQKFLVMPGRDRPLIWDLSTNEPRPTPFYVLVPSSTSDRWLGVEKDTNQLVIADANFEIVDRLDFHPSKGRRFGGQLYWSPSERFAIWKTQVGIDYYSNWEGGWINLKTGEQQGFTGSYISEIVRFTGRRGEFIRVGADGVQGQMQGLLATGFHFQIFKNGNLQPLELCGIKFDSEDQSKIERGSPDLQTMQFSPDYEQFVFGLSRTPQPPAGTIMHLMDRHKNLWRLPDKDSGEYVSPYDVVGFAQDGKTIIANDKKRLFALPVSAITVPENRVKNPFEN